MMTQNNPKCAETLTALFFDEDDMEEDFSPRRSRKWMWSVAVLSSLLIAGSLVAYRPDIPQQWGIDTGQFTPGNLSRLPVVQKIWPGEPKAGADPVAPAVPGATQSAEPVQPAPAPPPINEITGSGHVTATQSATIFSPLEGRAASVSVELGDWVEAGQELLRLEGELCPKVGDGVIRRRFEFA